MNRLETMKRLATMAATLRQIPPSLAGFPARCDEIIAAAGTMEGGERIAEDAAAMKAATLAMMNAATTFAASIEALTP